MHRKHFSIECEELIVKNIKKLQKKTPKYFKRPESCRHQEVCAYTRKKLSKFKAIELVNEKVKVLAM